MSGAEPALLAAAAGTAGTAGTAAAASAIPAWLSAAGTGALMGGIGSAIMGGDPLQGALMGGVTGGIGSATGLTGSIGSLFSGGSGTAAVDAASGALTNPGALAEPMLANAPDIAMGGLGDIGRFSAMAPIGSVATDFSAGLAAPAASSTSSGLGLGGLTQYLPYAGLAGGSMLLDSMMAPEQVGPDGRKPRETGAPVSPLARTAQDVDPQSYFGAGGNRSFYQPYGMSPQFMAGGGRVGGKDHRETANQILAMMGEDHPMLDSAAHIVNRYTESDYPAGIISYIEDEYGDVPVTKEMTKAWVSLGNGGKNKGLKTFMTGERYAKGGCVQKFKGGGEVASVEKNTAYTGAVKDPNYDYPSRHPFIPPALEAAARQIPTYKPLNRAYTPVDPKSYFRAAPAGSRMNFQPKKMANGGSSSASSSNIPRGYADGGGIGLGMVKGKGDGRSDDIPAMLSDGEFVFSAPVVSALGNGSNDAGAKKLEKIQKGILQKHYKGGKAVKAQGLGGYA